MAQKRKRTDVAKPRKSAGENAGFVLGPRAETKQRLLAATLRYLGENGVSDISLRQLADQLGTSHRLLIYHFGTKEGLLVAVVEELERELQQWLQTMWERELTPMELLRWAWERTCDPSLDRLLRLFVEMYGHAVQGRAHTAPLLDTLVDAWLEPVSNIFRRMGYPTAQARVHARLQLATARGLMLDLVVTGDLKATTAAYEQYISQYAKMPGANKIERRRRKAV